MYDAGGPSCARVVSKYSLAAVPRDPISMTTLAAASMAATVAGSGISAVGQLGAGEAANTAAQMSATATRNAAAITAAAQEQGGALSQEQSEFQAEQLDQNAATTRGQSQRQAFDINNQARLALSTLRARASGSGLSATGETTSAVAGSIGQRGSYLSLTAMANGENTARGMEDQAYGARLTGAIANYGGQLAALGTRSGADATAAGDIFKGQAAQTASEFGAAGTLASGIGTATSNYGKVMFPTSTGKAGV